MKKIFSVLLFFSLVEIAWSLDLIGSFYGSVELIKKNNLLYASRSYYQFKENTYRFFHSLEWEELNNWIIPDELIIDNKYYESGKGSIVEKGLFNYLVLESDSEFTYKKKLGILYDPTRLYLFDKDELFFSSNEGLRLEGTMPRVVSVITSSSLVEQQKEYNGDYNLYPNAGKLNPWVEGVNGQGIGEWIEISTDSYQFTVDFFLISNGYVSFEKPYLYKYNSRVKRLRIKNEELNIDFEVELEDTPNFQEIRLPKEIIELETTFRFTIMEVYPGTKWEDTCLNLIIPLGDLPDEK
ncbi:MAG: hypothetical protein U9N32_04170 [Spirochaetota bacterium]|nr:hypothetical protein [Spirochaetota bacterium]